MGRKRYTAEHIIRMPRQVEVELSRGQRVIEVCRGLGLPNGLATGGARDMVEGSQVDDNGIHQPQDHGNSQTPRQRWKRPAFLLHSR